jgi:putative ATP-binding cassette transporter
MTPSTRKRLLLRFWRSASGFWRGPTARRAWLLVVLLVATVILQLLVQYRLNFWSRDFFNAIEQKSGDALRMQALIFMPLAAASLALTVTSVWSRMTTEREWRRWLSHQLYDYWLLGERHMQLKFMQGDHQTPEYRISDDARVATDQPIDLVLGLLSSFLTSIAFISVLWSVGGSIDVELFGAKLGIPGYLVICVLAYSFLLTSATMFINRRLTSVVERNKHAEANLRATGAQLRAIGEGAASTKGPRDGRHAIGVALEAVIARWRVLCFQMMRMMFVSDANKLIAPAVGLLVCGPKYLAGTMTLGGVVQAGAAFVVVQGAFSYIADNYGRLAEWASSACRVASLLESLDQLETAEQAQNVSTDEQIADAEAAPKVIPISRSRH